MEASNYHNPMLLNLEEYTVREKSHSGTPPSPMHDRKLQWVFRDCFNRSLDRQREALPKFRASVFIPCPRLFQVCARLW